MSNASIHEDAALWMARARDPKFADWDALTDWLEASPAHNLAYERAFAAHDLVGEDAVSAKSAPRPGWSAPRIFRHSRRTILGVAGAAMAAAAAMAIVFLPRSTPRSITVAETRPGEQRVVQLSDGTHIALNGGSRVSWNVANDRNAVVERGEALFSVVHDPDRPFTVDVSGERLIDLGTRFDVRRDEHGIEVAVSQGAVLFDPNGAAVRLIAGRMLRKSDASRLVVVTDTEPGTVGAWQSGRLVYRDALLDRVADDLGRVTGARMQVAPELAGSRFTGVIIVPAIDRSAFLQRLGPVLGVDVAKKSEGYYLKAHATR